MIGIVEHLNAQGVGVIHAQDGTPWFCAKDLLGWLEYATNQTPTILKQHVEADDRRRVAVAMNINGYDYSTRVWYVNESGLCALIFGSPKPAAKRFKHWVTSTIGPSMRKTGQYAIPGSEMAALMRAIESVNAVAEQLLGEIDIWWATGGRSERGYVMATDRPAV